MLLNNIHKFDDTESDKDNNILDINDISELTNNYDDKSVISSAPDSVTLSTLGIILHYLYNIIV